MEDGGYSNKNLVTWHGMVRYGMVRSMVRTGPPRLARDNGQGQGGHAGNVLAPPEREREGGLSPIHRTSSVNKNIFHFSSDKSSLYYDTLS